MSKYFNLNECFSSRIIIYQFSAQPIRYIYTVLYINAWDFDISYLKHISSPLSVNQAIFMSIHPNREWWEWRHSYKFNACSNGWFCLGPGGNDLLSLQEISQGNVFRINWLTSNTQERDRDIDREREKDKLWKNRYVFSFLFKNVWKMFHCRSIIASDSTKRQIEKVSNHLVYFVNETKFRIIVTYYLFVWILDTSFDLICIIFVHVMLTHVHLYIVWHIRWYNIQWKNRSLSLSLSLSVKGKFNTYDCAERAEKKKMRGNMYI